MQHENLFAPTAGFRRARTRTLIQLGGLLDKAGLPHLMNIEIGADLQKDPVQKEEALKLMGALVVLHELLQREDISPHLLREKGKRALASEILKEENLSPEAEDKNV